MSIYLIFLFINNVNKYSTKRVCEWVTISTFMMLPIKKLFTLPVNKLWLKEIVPDNKCIPIANKQITHWKPVLNVHTFLKGHVKSISSALFPKEETSMFTLNALFGPLKFGIAQPRTYPQLPLSFANGQLFGGALQSTFLLYILLSTR